MHQELLLDDTLKCTKNVTEKDSFSCIFQTIIVIVLIKIPEKYLLRSLV